jgi:hypothetical protein
MTKYTHQRAYCSFPSWRTLSMISYCGRKTEQLEDKSVSAPLCPSHIPHAKTRAPIRPFTTRVVYVTNFILTFKPDFAQFTHAFPHFLNLHRHYTYELITIKSFILPHRMKSYMEL